jgi:hypothetical protein
VKQNKKKMKDSLIQDVQDLVLNGHLKKHMWALGSRKKHIRMGVTILTDYSPFPKKI